MARLKMSDGEVDRSFCIDEFLVKIMKSTEVLIQSFEKALIEAQNDTKTQQENPIIYEAWVAKIESKLADLREELAAYELPNNQ